MHLFPGAFHMSVYMFCRQNLGVTSYLYDHSSRTVDCQFQTLRNEISGCVLSLYEIPLFSQYENVFQSTCSNVWVTEENSTPVPAYTVGHYKLLVVFKSGIWNSSSILQLEWKEFIFLGCSISRILFFWIFPPNNTPNLICHSLVKQSNILVFCILLVHKLTLWKEKTRSCDLGFF